MDLLNPRTSLYLFCLALPLCGCGGEKYMEYGENTIVFDIHKDSIYIDGVLYPDLYRELNGKILYENNPLYDIGLKLVDDKNRKLKEQGRCKEIHNSFLSVGKREIDIARCIESPEKEMQVHIRVDGDVSGRVLREISSGAFYFFAVPPSVVLDRDFKIPLASSPAPNWASPMPASTHKVKCVLKRMLNQTADSNCEEGSEEPEKSVTKSYMELSISYSEKDSVYYANYRRRPPMESHSLKQSQWEKIEPNDLISRLQQESESKSLEEREYPILITVYSEARVLEPLKAAEAALQSGLKIAFGFTYTTSDYP